LSIVVTMGPPSHSLRRIIQLSGMRFMALSTLAFLVACTISLPPVTTYTATIERVSERPGDHFSPIKGHKPLICLDLLTGGVSNEGKPDKLRLLVLDIYQPEIYGRVGDKVVFRYRGDLPSNGEIDFSALIEYRILTKDG
jgi:hypothetical protein